MKQPNIIHIQKYSIHDGEGIRTTVFFKGCPLKCLWCHNPESQNYSPELMYNHEKCTKCRSCEMLCPQKAIRYSDEKNMMITDVIVCSLCDTCTDSCMVEARKIEGRQISINELVKEIKKDTVFYENSKGGVTLSGGEVMTQDMEYIERLMQILHTQGYRINIDTCGYAPFENFKRVLPYTDTFLYDIKILDGKKHKEFTGCDNQLILDNVTRLSMENANINIRIPVIRGVNADAESMMDIIHFLKENVKFTKVNLLPYHNIAKGKYDQLNRDYPDSLLQVPDAHTMSELVGLFTNENIGNVQIGG